MAQRLRGLFGTVPGVGVWAGLLGLALALLAASWLLDRLGLVAWRPDLGFLLGIGAIAAFGTSVVEEAVFRGLLLRPDSGAGGSLLSAMLFTLWHPLQTFVYRPLWEAYAWTWWFLLATFLLGLACARLTLAARSLWPAILLHWLMAMGWKTLYGIPSCGPAAGAFC
jgi:CAAX protease family protein